MQEIATQPFSPGYPFQRPPVWRFQKARAMLEADEFTEFPAEYPWLNRAVGFMFARRDQAKRKSRDSFEQMFGDCLAAARLYEYCPPQGLRWVLEALMVGGASCDDILPMLQTSEDFPEDVLVAYSKMFFDIEQYGGNRLFLQTHILNAAKASGGLRLHDFGWKSYAYAWGFRRFIEDFLLSGHPLGGEGVRWMAEQTRDAVLARTLTAAAGSSSYLDPATGDLLRIGLVYADAQKRVPPPLDDDPKKKFLKELSDAVHISLRDVEIADQSLLLDAARSAPLQLEGFSERTAALTQNGDS